MADLGTIDIKPLHNFGVIQVPQDDAIFNPVPSFLSNSNHKRVRKHDSLKSVVGGSPVMTAFHLGDRLMVRDTAVSPKRTISGITRKQGATATGIKVVVLNRSNGVVLGSTVSGVGGAYSVSILGFSGECYVIAYDESNEAIGATVIDRVVPI